MEMVYSVLNLANLFLHKCCVVATMNNHLQARLGDLNAGSIIARFQALDHMLWPPIGESRESKTAFIVHSKAAVTALSTHYQTVMERQNSSKDDTLHEYPFVQDVGYESGDICPGDIPRIASERYIVSQTGQIICDCMLRVSGSKLSRPALCPQSTGWF